MTSLPVVETIREFSALDDDAIRHEVLSSGKPAVMRGLVRKWPAVNLSSPTAMVEYLRRFDNGTPVDAIMAPPEIEGRIFYDDVMNGFNFVRNKLPIGAIAEQVLRYSSFARAPAVAAQSALIPDCLPGFSAENALTVIDAAILPRIWLGNAITTPTHLDEWNNIGCVVSGRRRFTLFPPEQLVNLYIGPLDFAPTGAPLSLVSVREPDFARFPKFREALAAALSAELGPGDALYIPPLWWHHVESLEPFNLLVNYWWHAAGGTATGTDSAFDALIHAMLNLRTLPPATREAWRTMFEHYVFGVQAAVT
ncbi:MAG TPA: cupin-like domain-containing protein [Steroidobacteraceae bacterium]